MRVKVIRRPDPTSSEVTLVVQRWCDGQWENVRDFSLSETDQAHAFAMGLSLTKRVPVEIAAYEDGEKISEDQS